MSSVVNGQAERKSTDYASETGLERATERQLGKKQSSYRQILEQYEAAEVSAPPPRNPIKLRLDVLKPHSRQHEVFPDGNAQDIKGLAEDIRRNGLMSPIEVAADQVTIICGHRRVAAAKLLGRTEIDAIIRDDLTSEEAVFERFVSDNFNRRQLDPISMARCYLGLKENAKNLPYDQQRPYRGDMRDFLAKRFRMSGRNLNRYVKVLNAPLEIQQAVTNEALSLKAAGKVADATKEVQELIVGKIKLGLDPERVVRDNLLKERSADKQAASANTSFMRTLKAGVNDLEARLDEVATLSDSDAQTFRTAVKVINKILKKAKTVTMAKNSDQ